MDSFTTLPTYEPATAIKVASTSNLVKELADSERDPHPCRGCIYPSFGFYHQHSRHLLHTFLGIPAFAISPMPSDSRLPFTSNIIVSAKQWL
ncbi:hypothetical protein D9611_013249 [Ephemerocybe angulata]|uniref:Uncharacterized protein n=1 Tax=Ephemerocybe angulata TaxID=980116 RepID=A0A8H5CC34_9AGAR|nr:hypothetical protein D9611_013249 [Tulosesus angulatus]